jgi:hypothetical protein
MKRDDTRTTLARAMGLGSAKDGVQSWWMERVSAIALVSDSIAHSTMLPHSAWFAGDCRALRSFKRQVCGPDRDTARLLGTRRRRHPRNASHRCGFVDM